MKASRKLANGVCLALATAANVNGFVWNAQPTTNRALTSYKSSLVSVQSNASNSVEEADCGCTIPTVYSGKPSNEARENINYRAAIATEPIYTVDGEQTSIDEIIGSSSANPTRTSLVVFMRSLG